MRGSFKNMILALFCLLGLFSLAPTVNAADSLPPRKIRAAVTSLAGSMSPPWAANEAKIFAKYGLQVEVIITPSGLQGMNTLIAREVDFVHIAGGTTAGAAVGGADVKIIATNVATCC